MLWTEQPLTPAGVRPSLRTFTEAATLVVYVEPRTSSRVGTHVPPGFGFRWTIWSRGTLLAEGFTDSESSAKSAAEQEVDRVEDRIRTAVRALDIRNGKQGEVL